MALPKVNFQVIIHPIMILTNVSFASLSSWSSAFSICCSQQEELRKNPPSNKPPNTTPTYSVHPSSGLCCYVLVSTNGGTKCLSAGPFQPRSAASGSNTDETSQPEPEASATKSKTMSWKQLKSRDSDRKQQQQPLNPSRCCQNKPPFTLTDVYESWH